jgi:6-phosphogluconolactonase
LYDKLSCIPEFFDLKGLSFYFSDERCVGVSHHDSNYGMVVRTLFRSGIPNGWKVYPFNGVASNHEFEAKRYSQLLPDILDILLFGVGLDGHIASIFPGSKLLNNFSKQVSFIPARDKMHDRFTFSPLTIARGNTIYLLAPTKLKRDTLEKCQDPNEWSLKNMPVACLLLRTSGFEGRGELKIL